MANTTVPAELSSTPSIIDNGNATAIEINSSEHVTINGDTFINRGTQTTGVIKLGGTTDGAFVDFDGGSLQFNTQRDPNTGTFVNTSKSHASIIMQGNNADSNIRFYTTTANNTTATQRMVIDKNGFLGLGTASPNMAFNISHGDEDGIRLNTANTAASFIDFGDTDDNDIGRISYDHADNSMRFRTNNTEQLKIDPNGWILLNGGNAQQYSDNQRTYSGSEGISWSSSTSANTWTSSYYMTYQKFVEAGLHFGYVGNGAISTHYKISMCNTYSGLSIQTLHSAFGGSGNAYHTISFTSGGSFSTRTLKITNTPAGGQNTSNLAGTIYYGFAI